jgi:hypothetical protein
LSASALACTARDSRGVALIGRRYRFDGRRLCEPVLDFHPALSRRQLLELGILHHLEELLLRAREAIGAIGLLSLRNATALLASAISRWKYFLELGGVGLVLRGLQKRPPGRGGLIRSAP